MSESDAAGGEPEARLASMAGTRKWIALLSDDLVVRKILEHLGLTTEPSHLAPARTPPEPEFAG